MYQFTKTISPPPDPLASIFEAALGESPAEARRLGIGWRKQRSVVRGLWKECATVSLQASLDRSEKIRLLDEDLLQSYLDSTACSTRKPTGVVLLTIHMGDYIHALLKITTLTSNREVLILRRKKWSADEQAMFGKINQIGHQLETIRHGPMAARKLASALRRGAIVILLYDLSPRWGETTPVNIFNTRLHWVFGPLYLSMLGRAQVIPFFTFKENAHWTCEVNAVRDYSIIAGNRGAFLKKEMQEMASMAEGYIRQHTIQWNHWHLLPEMAQRQVRTDG